MKTLDSRELIEDKINNNKMVLVYFGGNSCGVCVDLKPKIENLLKEYPNIKLVYIDAEKSHNIAISYDFYTMPGIVLFVEGKETIREARNISVDSIDEKISRYYNMIFE